MIRRMGWLPVAVVMAVVVVGCGGAGRPKAGPDPVSATGPPPASPPLAQICGGGTGNPPATRHLDKSFRTVVAFDCETSDVLIPGEGKWNEEREGRATTSLAALVKALRQPDKHRDTDAICTMQITFVEPFALEDADGHLARPSLPVSSCGSGSPQAGALHALETVHWATIATRRLEQVETQAEVTSGCRPIDFDQLVDDAQAKDRLLPTTRAPFPPSTSSVKVCVYHASTDASGEQEGRFVSGGTLTGSPLQHVLGGITGRPATTGCKIPHSLYAVMTAAPSLPPVQVELDGCRRALHTDTTPIAHTQDSVSHELVSQSTTAVDELLEQVGRE